MEGYLTLTMRGEIGSVLLSDNPRQAYKVLMGIPAITSWQVLVFSALGILVAIGKEFKVSLQLHISISIIILAAIRYGMIRYLFLTIPLLVIFAAYGIIRIYEYTYRDMSALPNLLSTIFILVILLGLTLSLYVMGDYFVRTLTWLSLNLSEESLVVSPSFSPIFVIPIAILSIITAIIIAALSQENLKNNL
jgi:hypothetical protein